MNLVYFPRKNWKGNMWLVTMRADTICKICLEPNTGLYVLYEFECTKFSKQQEGNITVAFLMVRKLRLSHVK